MALGTVQVGCRNSLYVYPAGCKTESDSDYAELLAKLTTELELAWNDGEEEPVTEEDREDSEQLDAHMDRKKEWEELLKQSVTLEVMLRQMLENGLGQQKEEPQKQPEKKEEEEPDNEFNLSGVPVAAEGKNRSNTENSCFSGNSQFFQTKTGYGAEYFSMANGGRQYCEGSHAICLTCETECNRKKQWKITE